MKFCEILNEYMAETGCLAKSLSERSGISPATLSRYRSGERHPATDSDAFARICSAIAELASENGPEDISTGDVRERFLRAEDYVHMDSTQLFRNFDVLVSSLDISINRLCRSINYDVSTVYRFRSGTRRPAEPEKFASLVAGYVVREFDSAASVDILAELIGADRAELQDSAVCVARLTEWLLESKTIPENTVSGFLSSLDDFNLDEYIKSIHFDELKVPTAPFQLPGSKMYYGLKEMMDSEIDFLKATVLSRSMEPVIIYSDMPMGEMAKDPEFPKKWMFGMAMMLKKGLHLNMIHNLERSFEDMMLGLESFIPMYMTGQISPFYLKNVPNGAFSHLIKVSGVAALAGEAIAGHHEDGRYYLTKSKKELEYYKKRANDLLSSATPLMDIYTSDNAKALATFLSTDAARPGRRRSILSTLPIYTIREPLLESILERHGVEEAEIQRIKANAAAKKTRVESILAENPVEDEITSLSEEDFASHPLPLELSGTFLEKDIYYTYDEYLEHLASTEAFAGKHPGYTLKKTSSQAFRNLQILIHEGKWAMVSKGKTPAIHFVIFHPKLLNAIENFVPPVVE